MRVSSKTVLQKSDKLVASSLVGIIVRYSTLPHTMYYQFTVPLFINSLTALKGVLQKGEAYAKEKGLSDEHMLNLRLAPDMFPLVKQVQVATDNAKGAAGRLSGKDIPTMEDTEKTFAELYNRIDKTVEYLHTFSESDFADAANQVIKLKYFPQDMHFTGDGYARGYAIPNFLFHVTTAYDILRAHGVSVGKADYMGTLPLVKD